MTDTPTFTDLGVDEKLADALSSKGITHPFPIQELTLPMALKGADLIGQARTGTGKTLAFGLPLLQAVDTSKQQTQAIVIVPTRELCVQVADDLTVGEASGVTSIAVYGGVGFDEQIEALRGGVHVVVGTPGRTLDHLNRGNLDLSKVRVAVLDEADEMLDMGFLPDVERLLSACPEDRQTLLFSATMPTAIVKLARRFMTKPTFMRAEAEQSQTASTVDQHFFLVHRMDKPRVLARLLQTEGRGGAFVFTRTKNMADRLVRELEDLRVSAIAVHGDLRQTTREKNLDRFRAGKADVLVATEVAARGLDVDNVTHVVNYDCPDDEKMYLHRIGRTARAGNRGVAVTFAEFNEVDRLSVIRKAVGATEDDVLEVFSTSDALTNLFDLPEETPWDHMARGGSSSGGRSSGSSGSSGGGSTGSSRDGRRRASSDGRPKSTRASQGGPGSDRSRARGSSSSKGTDDGAKERSSDRSRSGDATERSPARAAATSGDGDDARTRTRTRTRTRDRSSGSKSEDRESPRSSSGSSSSGSSSSSTSSSGSSSSSTSSSGSSSSSTSSSGSSSSGGGRTRARRRGQDGPSEGRSRSGSSTRSDRGGRDTGSRSRSDGSDNGSRSDGDKRASSNGRDRSRSGGGRSSSSKGSSGRSRSGNADDGGSGRGQKDPGDRRTRRGEEARGEGTPRHHRRVTVDHLP